MENALSSLKYCSFQNRTCWIYLNNIFLLFSVLLFWYFLFLLLLFVFSNSISKCSVPVENLKTVQHFPFQTGSSPIWVETVAFCNSSIYIHFQLKWKKCCSQSQIVSFSRIFDISFVNENKISKLWKSGWGRKLIS